MRSHARTRPWVAASLAMLVLVLGATASAQEFKIGVFDAARVSEETDVGKRVQKTLNDFRDAKQAEITAKEQQLAALQNQLNTQALSLSADKRADLEKQIQRKVLELNQVREGAAREMQLEVAEAQGLFEQKLLQVIEQFGASEGFSLILEKSFVAYSAQTSDVTTAIVDRFNAIFAVEGAGEAEAEADSGGDE